VGDDRVHGDLISLLMFFQTKESTLINRNHEANGEARESREVTVSIAENRIQKM
jgi:hypothetical protein